ncbi:MAG: glutamyl-tRNA reductase [Anaerolineae bacterium]|nr:glutamyl-tRNA reductase [Anaerolineae bacterium]
MSIVLVGLNHHTAPVALREQLTLTGCALRMALEELHIENASEAGAQQARAPGSPPVLREGVILSTCNRLEVYAVTDDAAHGWAEIARFLSRLQGISPAQLRLHLYRLADREAVTHLMRVAAGLDSMILGEPQILGQVGQAFHDAHAAGATGPILSHLFAEAVHAGKRARSETAISRHTTSVSHAAVLLAEAKLGDLSAARVVLVGSGEMAEQAARALQAHCAHDITCINRTYARAEALARRVGARARNWSSLAEALAQADVLLTATGAPHIVIDAGDVAAALPQREGRPLLIIDIAVPRDVDEAAGALPGVARYDIDDLQSAVDANLARRGTAVPQVEAIIDEEAVRFMEWLHSRQIVPVIADLRRQAEALARAEVEQALRRLEGLDAHGQEVVARMAHRIVRKLLHTPTVRLKALAESGNGYVYAHAMWELFDLGEREER